ncbi:MAG TPA: carboxypeptidase-like regulatory domain-containing protein, partial [Saprospiraceae bacterium]
MQQWRYWLAFVLVIGSSIQVFGQGTIRGKISDENGEAMIGVSVFLKENPAVGVSTDLDGIYSIQVAAGTSFILVINYISYEPIEETIIAEGGQVLIRDFVMTPASVSLGEVQVVAKQEKRNQYYMESIKKKSANTLDYMSGDMMSKIGDNNVSAAIARVTGVASNGPFITVRGLGDRYVQTCVNGALIPTLDPFTNNIKLDLFPASFVDNIIITKTASPDLPGDWSAAYISIETKDNPDKLSIFVETKFGFNTQTSFKKIINNNTSPMDWLGYDNGFRDVDHEKVVDVNPQPTPYEQMCALGLDGFYRSIGVSSNWDVGSQIGETYFNLGLVELGLLGKAYVRDPQAINRAKEQFYAGAYQNDAFRAINQKAEESLNDFANNWNTFEETAPHLFSQVFSIGNQSKVFGKTISYLGGFRYANGVQYDPNATLSRTVNGGLDSMGVPYVDQKYDQQFARYSNGWTALANANLKWDANNSFTITFMPNLIGSNQIREGVDQVGTTLYKFAFIQGQFYEERSQFVYQYKSEHFFPSSSSRLLLSASYTDGNSSAPDFKRLQYFSDDSINYRLDKTISDVRRNFRYLDENVLDTRASFEFPLRDRPGYVSKFKFGAGYVEKKREALQHDYLLRPANGVTTDFKDGDLDALFADEKFDIRYDSVSGLDRIDLYYRKTTDPGNHTIGNAKVASGFVMIDESITKKLRISGGLRAEYSKIYTDVKEFYELGYAADDLRRITEGAAFVLTPGKTEQWNFLPSGNLIYQLREDEIAPSNLRLNYSQSLARPSLREYSESVVRDFELNADVFGNANLEFVNINNYDIRYENYFKSGNFLSASVFYKTFENHIELTNSNFGFTWSNADESYVYGLELEGRLRLGPKFEFRSNLSVVNSFTRVEDRRLQIENGIKSWIVVGIDE